MVGKLKSFQQIVIKKKKKKLVESNTQWSITQPLKRIHLNQF